MNRYPVWKYAIIVIVLLVGLIYALPNFFGEAPAVQVSSAKSTVKVDAGTQARIEEALKAAGLAPDLLTLDATSVRARFVTPTISSRRATCSSARWCRTPNDPSYVVALNLLSRSPAWLTALHAYPMYLGLDLRGGVDFLLQVDMKGAHRQEGRILRRATSARACATRASAAARSTATARRSRYASAMPPASRPPASACKTSSPTSPASTRQEGGDFKLTATIKPEAARRLQDAALKQNITTLHNRINELGVAEPVIQQQGLDRIVVQLPGVQDTAKAKDILGRTATLEMRLVDESAEGRARRDRQRPGALRLREIPRSRGPRR